MDFLEFRWDSRVTTGNSGFLLCWPRKSNLPFELPGRAGDWAPFTEGQTRPHLGLYPGLNVPLHRRQGFGVAFHTHPGSQASSRGEAKDSTLFSSRDRYLLEPIEWPKGSKASCEVWRKDQGLLSRSGRKRCPQSRDDGGVSWVFPSCGASVGFLTRYDGELREPLMWRQ